MRRNDVRERVPVQIGDDETIAVIPERIRDRRREPAAAKTQPYIERILQVIDHEQIRDAISIDVPCGRLVGIATRCERERIRECTAGLSRQNADRAITARHRDQVAARIAHEIERCKLGELRRIDGIDVRRGRGRGLHNRRRVLAAAQAEEHHDRGARQTARHVPATSPSSRAFPTIRFQEPHLLGNLGAAARRRDEPFRARALAEPALQRTDSTEVGLNKNNNNRARQAK